MASSHSFTTTSTGGLLRALQNDCEIAPAFDPAAVLPHPAFRRYSAIWDTGATGSVITDRVVNECGLKPISVRLVHGVGGSNHCPVFLVNIGLPNKVGVVGVQVTLGKLIGCDMLIGMDVINLGDFAVTNKNGLTVFTFRMPSLKCIDFVKEDALLSRNIVPSGGGGFRGHPHKQRHGKNKKR